MLAETQEGGEVPAALVEVTHDDRFSGAALARCTEAATVLAWVHAAFR